MYFLNRCPIKRMRNLFFYSLPNDPAIYRGLVFSLKEQLLKLQAQGQRTVRGQTAEELQVNPAYRCRVTCCFTKFDFLKLERAVGTAQAREFLAEYNKISNFILTV